MPRVRTVVLSDLHLGALAGTDLASSRPHRRRLMESLEGAERVVLLGDVVEERERPLASLLEAAAPFFDDLAEVTAGRRVTIVPGNHDHGIADPWLSRMRLEGQTLGSEQEWPVEAGDGSAGWIARRMPETEVTLAYPGLRLRPDVYATHGHYLDLHLTVPRIESIAASAVARMQNRSAACATAADYEHVMAPLYKFFAGLAQGTSTHTLSRSSRASRDVWERVTGGGRLARLLLGRVVIGGGVVVLNRLGIGPFKPELSGRELHRSGLLSMGRVAEVLAPGAAHVVFGHTHRAGPLAGDKSAEWTTPSGTRLWNSGTWMVEVGFIHGGGVRSPYWPGTLVHVDAEGPPRLENVMHDVALPRYAAAGSGSASGRGDASA
jgi:hypothetical protein